MTIASRTPDGTPNRCDVCGKKLRVQPSSATLDAPCPHCGHLLWFDAPVAPSIRAPVAPSIGAPVAPSIRRPSRCSYEGFLLEVAEDRFGRVPYRLLPRLYRAVATLKRQKRLIERPELRTLVERADGWDDIADQLDARVEAAPRLRSLRAVVCEKLKRLFAVR